MGQRKSSTWRDGGRSLKQSNQPVTSKNALKIVEHSLDVWCFFIFFSFWNKCRRKRHPPLDGRSIWVGFCSEHETAVPEGWHFTPLLPVKPRWPWPQWGLRLGVRQGVRSTGKQSLQEPLFPIAGRRVSCLVSETVFKLVATHNMIYSLFLMSLWRLSICISAGDF